MKFSKKALISRITELDRSVTKEELIGETIEELKERLEELCDTSSLFPNGRDFEDEDDD